MKNSLLHGKSPKNVNNYDLLKVIAIITMVIDHIGLYILGDNLNCRIIGRMSAPIFFFLIGYNLSYKFRPRLLIYGLVLTIFTYYFSGTFSLNILLNFLLVRLFLNYSSSILKANSTIALLSIYLAYISLYILPFIDYSTFGLLVAISGKLSREGRKIAFPLFLFSIIMFIVPFLVSFDFSITQLILFALIFTLLLFLYALKLDKICLNITNNILIKILSYNSLSIYVTHLVLLIYFFGKKEFL